MRKRLITVSLLCGALFSLTACGNYAIPDSTPLPSQTAEANPFDEAEEAAGFLAMLTHGVASADFPRPESVCHSPMTAASFGWSTSFPSPARWIPLDFSCFWTASPSPTR